MSYPKSKIILIAIFGLILLIGFTYLAVFGRALGQEENHLAIALALPKVIFGSEVVRIDQETYLTRDRNSFIKAMERQGFIYVEQMGSGHFFRKEGNGYGSYSRMYSSQFMLFSYPTGN